MLEAARVVIVQHGDKQRLPGDPGLSELGHAQAERVARFLSTTSANGLYASPQRRALETAEPIALAVGVSVTVDPRLAERMNWEGHQNAEAFLEEWARTVTDRDYKPSNGVSSRAAAARFMMFLDETHRDGRSEPIVAVSHGGVTIDLLRDLIGDARLHAAAPALITRGLPPCGLTTIAGGPGNWRVLAIGEQPWPP